MPSPDEENQLHENGADQNPEASDPPGDKLSAERQRQILNDQITKALSRATPRQAVVIMMAGQLSEVFLNIGNALARHTDGRPLTLNDIEEQSPAVDSLIRLSKQRQQVEQLLLRLEQAGI